VIWERRASDPMLDLTLFRHGRFRWGITSGLLSYLVMFGVLFLVPFYFERGLGIGVGQAGLELMMMPLALGVVAPFAGRLADRLGTRPLTVGGMSLVAIGLFSLGALRPTTLGFLALLALVGIGLGCFTPPNNSAIMGSVPEQQSGLASGVLNMTRGMGTALGLALTGLVFDLSGGASLARLTVGHAFSLTAFFLGGAATAAVLVSAFGEPARSPESRTGVVPPFTGVAVRKPKLRADKARRLRPMVCPPWRGRSRSERYASSRSSAVGRHRPMHRGDDPGPRSSRLQSLRAAGARCLGPPCAGSPGSRRPYG